jgi:hypothetical protein
MRQVGRGEIEREWGGDRRQVGRGQLSKERGREDQQLGREKNFKCLSTLCKIKN